MSAAQVVECFGRGTSLYAVLGVEKGASEAQLRRAYYKKALVWHPDKDPSPAATKKFQALGFVHALLADPARRAVATWTACSATSCAATSTTRRAS